MPTTLRLQSGAMARARSAMRMDGILGTDTSPPRMRARLSSTKSTPWRSVSQKRVISSSVMGRTPVLRRSRKSGTTLPRLPTTLP